MSARRLCLALPSNGAFYLKSICLSMVMAVTTLAGLPVDRLCNSNLDEIRAVVNSVSAAVPAPQLDDA